MKVSMQCNNYKDKESDATQTILQMPIMSPVTIASEAPTMFGERRGKPDVEEVVVESEEIGVAIGEVGLYVTPFAVAATSKTEPFPYS